MVTATRRSPWLFSWKSTVIPKDASCFHRGQTDELNGNMIESPNFRSWRVTWIPTLPLILRCHIVVYLPSWPGMEKGAVSTWPAPHTPQIKDPTTKYISLSHTSKDQKNNHWVGWLKQWISLTRFSHAPTLKGGPRWWHRSLDNKVNLDPTCSINQNVWVFPFPQRAVTLVGGYTSIWRKTGRILPKYICPSVISFWRPHIFFSQWILRQKTGSNLETKQEIIISTSASFWSPIYDFFWWLIQAEWYLCWLHILILHIFDSVCRNAMFYLPSPQLP